VSEEQPYKSWMCIVCGLIYEEEKGWPDDGIPPGTRWEDVPEDWVCPDCGAGKEDFEMVEM
jgi:rubredoxin-NAD+ reductase